MTSPALSRSTPNGRFYVHPRSSREVPSITNIIGMMDKPALKYWAARQAAEFAADNVSVVSGLERAAAVDLIRGAPFRRTAKSGDTGDVVHNWIDGFIHGQPPADEEVAAAGSTARGMWKQFLGINGKYQPRWMMSEVTVWSEKHGYAGTLDWIAEIGGAVTLGDNKTGNNVYPEVGMQVAAAANADYGLTDDGEPFELPKFERFAVLHIRPRYARLSPLTGIEECFKAFLGLRAAHAWKCDTADSVIQYAPKIESR